MDVSFSMFFYFFAGLARIKESVKPWSRRIRKFPLNIYGEICGGRNRMPLLHKSLLPQNSMGKGGGCLSSSDSHFFRIHQEKEKHISSFLNVIQVSKLARKKWQKRINGKDSLRILNELFIESPPRLERRNIRQKFHFFCSPLWRREYSLTQGLEIRIKKEKTFWFLQPELLYIRNSRKHQFLKKAMLQKTHSIVSCKNRSVIQASHQVNRNGNNALFSFHKNSYLVCAFPEYNELSLKQLFTKRCW